MNKTIITKALLLSVLTIAVACSELKDDEHYSNTETPISNHELKIVNMTSQEYINSRSDLSSMNTLFANQGI